MPALSITKAYSSGAIFTEAHIDNFRSALLTLFNTTKLDVDNFLSTMALTDAKFSGDDLTTTDNSFIKFGDDDDGQIGLDASKNLCIKTTTSGCLLEFYTANTRCFSFDANNLKLYGDIYFGLGQSTYSLLYVLSRYKKPVLTYASTTRIDIESNTGTSSETFLAIPGRLLAVTETAGSSAKYRSALLTNTANGYDSSHTGNAKGGIKSGLTLTTDTWYAVYGVRVRYGNDAGNNFIMVFDTTLPTQANESTLNTTYGTNEWVYLGIIRYGYGAETPNNEIIPFKYSNKGWCYLYGSALGTTTVGGLILFSSTANGDNTPAYTLSDGTGDLQLPLDVIQRIQVSFYRAVETEFTIRSAADAIVWGFPGRTTADNDPAGMVTEVGIEAGMDFCINQITNSAVQKTIAISAFADKMVALGCHGHGV
ncbi:hypothetical protein [Caudoviricetes sp.]|nr:hypothetical protein [Caudoviricetes sp.]UOF79149.1 hypothetical protein [Caudoviricetes sp.]